MVAERIKGSDRGGSRGARCEINVAKQKQSKKTNKDTKKNENEHAQSNCCNPLVCTAKKASKKRVKRIIKKSYSKAKEKTDSRILTINLL